MTEYFTNLIGSYFVSELSSAFKGVAFPSDQGLHIVDGTKLNLTNAIGDMKNAMALSALISPARGTKGGPGERNIVVNLWDWDVAFSADDGQSWCGWNKTEQSPGACGEGGGGSNMGASGHLIMFHDTSWWASDDGGHNFKRGILPGGAGAFDYTRKAGSRSEPSGKCFATLAAPPTVYSRKFRRRMSASAVSDFSANTVDDEKYDAAAEDNDDDDDKDKKQKTKMEQMEEAVAEQKKELDSDFVGYTYTPGTPSQLGETPWRPIDHDEDAKVQYLMTSEDFGMNWTWTPFPTAFQATGLAVDPTTSSSFFAWTSSCLAHSTDDGKTWSACSKATGLTSGDLNKLIIKDSNTMFMIRNGKVPLRTTDAGKTWHELTSATPLFAHGATFDASLSWSGKTLVIHGVDTSAIARQQYGTAVWRSSDDGDTWTDETGDLVTISPGPGVWYYTDFYFVTRGEGVTVKRNFEA